MDKPTTDTHRFSFTLDGVTLSAEEQERIARAVRKAALFEIVDLGRAASIGRVSEANCGGCGQCSTVEFMNSDELRR